MVLVKIGVQACFETSYGGGKKGSKMNAVSIRVSVGQQDEWQTLATAKVKNTLQVNNHVSQPMD